MLENVTQVVTLVVTNTTKVVGLYVGVHEIATHSTSPNAVVLAFAALLIAGGQFSETTILAVASRFFGVQGKG